MTDDTAALLRALSDSELLRWHFLFGGGCGLPPEQRRRLADLLRYRAGLVRGPPGGGRAPEWHPVPKSPGATAPRLTRDERLDRNRVRQVARRERRRTRERLAKAAA